MNLQTGWTATPENRSPSACTSVVVIDIPSDTTDNDLREVFAKWGKIEDINNQAQDYGFAFVKYSDVWNGPEGPRSYAQLLDAVKRTGVSIKGTPCKVRDSKTTIEAVTRWRNDLVHIHKAKSVELNPNDALMDALW